MEEVRNDSNRLVCQIDKANRIVEIVSKGCKTTIQFNSNGTVKITHKAVKAA